MDVANDEFLQQRTELEDERRIAREAADVARARADAAAGRVVDFGKVQAWVDSIGTPLESPPPFSGR